MAKSKNKTKLSVFSQVNKQKLLIALIFVIGFGGFGVWKLAFSKAATPGPIVFIRSSKMYKANADGSAQTLINVLGPNPNNVKWSPDRTKLVYEECCSPVAKTYVINSDGTGKVLLNADQYQHAQFGTWSPDGKKIAFKQHGYNSTTSKGNGNIFTVNADGTGKKQITAFTDKYANYPSWSFDNSKLTFVIYEYTTPPYSSTIYKVNADGLSAPKQLTVGEFDWEAKWSPTMDLIAFTRFKQADGTSAIYTINGDGSNMKQLSGSIANAQLPKRIEAGGLSSSAYVYNLDWSPSGSQIAFGSGGYVNIGQTWSGYTGISVVNTNGSGTEIPILIDPVGGGVWGPQWSRDGSVIAFNTYSPSENIMKIDSMTNLGIDRKTLITDAYYFDW